MPSTSEPSGIFHAGRDDGLGSDEALLANRGSVENDRAHADEAFITDGAGVDDGAVADGHPVADETGEIIREVNHGVVLDVGVMTDDDAVDVAPEHGVVPDAGEISERHITEHDRAACEVNPPAERRRFAQKGVELLFELGLERVHPKRVSWSRWNFPLENTGKDCWRLFPAILFHGGRRGGERTD